MESITLQPIAKINGTVDLPGSKSITNRSLLLAALAKGTTLLKNFLDSDDTQYMINALRALKIRCKTSKNCKFCKITGNNGAFITKDPIKLFLGNAGTVMRSLTAVLSLNKNNVILTGEPRMKERPIGHLVDALRQGGAEINYLEKDFFPPLHVLGNFAGGKITVNGSISSQFLTALLISAPLARKDTTITIKNKLVSKPYIDITLNLIKSFGILIENRTYRRFFVHGKQQYQSPGTFFIEGDASSASYFLAAAAIKGGTVKVIGVGNNSVQGDVQFANILKKMGAIISLGENFISCTRNSLLGVDVDLNHIPDAAMTVALTALFANGATTLRNIYSWRLKETDRLFAMATELRKVGALVDEGKDFLRITPPKTFQFAKINTYNDQRMAMCFSLIALSGVPVTILNPKCVTKTFPDYFKHFALISTIA